MTKYISYAEPANKPHKCNYVIKPGSLCMSRVNCQFFFLFAQKRVPENETPPLQFEGTIL